MKKFLFALFVLLALVVIAVAIVALEHAGDRVYPTSKPASKFDPERPVGERYYSPHTKRVLP